MRQLDLKCDHIMSKFSQNKKKTVEEEAEFLDATVVMTRAERTFIPDSFANLRTTKENRSLVFWIERHGPKLYFDFGKVSVGAAPRSGPLPVSRRQRA